MLEAGGTLATYHIQRSLAKGGHGHVFMAQDPLKQPVAIKIAEDPDQYQAFQLEYWILSQVKHPNIVGCREFGEHRGHAFLVMDFVCGDDLFKVMRAYKNQSMPLLRALAICRQVCAGLQALHHAKDSDGSWIGAIHGDLAPNNLIVDQQNKVVIVDFGHVRFQGGAHIHKNGPAGGNVHFSEPAQHKGSFCQTSDYFAVGALLFFMLTSQSVYRSKDDHRKIDSLTLKSFAEWLPYHPLNQDLCEFLKCALMGLPKPFAQVEDMANALKNLIRMA